MFYTNIIFLSRKFFSSLALMDENTRKLLCVILSVIDPTKKNNLSERVLIDLNYLNDFIEIANEKPLTIKQLNNIISTLSNFQIEQKNLFSKIEINNNKIIVVIEEASLSLFYDVKSYFPIHKLVDAYKLSTEEYLFYLKCLDCPSPLGYNFQKKDFIKIIKIRDDAKSYKLNKHLNTKFKQICKNIELKTEYKIHLSDKTIYSKQKNSCKIKICKKDNINDYYKGFQFTFNNIKQNKENQIAFSEIYGMLSFCFGDSLSQNEILILVNCIYSSKKSRETIIKFIFNSFLMHLGFEEIYNYLSS